MGRIDVLHGKIMMTLIAGLFSKLGRCQFCIRTALLVALAAWACAGAAFLWLVPLALPLAAVAAALTMLWLAHLLAFAWRAATHREAGTADQPNLARRDFFPVFIRAAAFIAASSAVPALAAGQCPPGFYPCGNSGLCCKNGRGCVGNGRGCQ